MDVTLWKECKWKTKEILEVWDHIGKDLFCKTSIVHIYIYIYIFFFNF